MEKISPETRAIYEFLRADFNTALAKTTSDRSEATVTTLAKLDTKLDLLSRRIDDVKLAIGVDIDELRDSHENPNDISISDAETQSSNEHEPSDNINDDVHADAQPSNDNDVEIEPAVDLDNPEPKSKRYDKRDFVARKHGREREPWVQKPMPFPPKPSKKKDDVDFQRFAEMLRPVFLRMRLTNVLKMSPMLSI
ncbi:hypothetical protein ZWY2020_048460 [Hordeum vulgare]|nr:hypothetical protein ZWY2020_048460 [Hordeum vulgare]